jgi:uncharacterized protein YbjT (DUF2867 family)
MFAITGITGKVGGEVARNLLAVNQPVRAVVRDLRKGESWAQLGCDLVRADINDAGALTSAFKGAESVFVLVPPNFDPSPDFHEARATAATLKISDRGSASGQSRLSVHHRRTGDSIEPAYATHHYRASAWRVVDADYFSAARMVHGEL